MRLQADYIVVFVFIGIFIWFIVFLYFNGKKNRRLEEESKKNKEGKK